MTLIQISWSPECGISRLLEGTVNLFNSDPLRIKGNVQIAFKRQHVDFECVAELFQGKTYLDFCLLSPAPRNHDLDPLPSFGRQLACASKKNNKKTGNGQKHTDVSAFHKILLFSKKYIRLLIKTR